MTGRVTYNFEEIKRLSARIDQVQNDMDKTINAMKDEANRELGQFVGQARAQYDKFVQAFDQEKSRLFNLLDDTQEDTRKHILRVQQEEEMYKIAFERTTNRVGIA